MVVNKSSVEKLTKNMTLEEAEFWASQGRPEFLQKVEKSPKSTDAFSGGSVKGALEGEKTTPAKTVVRNVVETPESIKSTQNPIQELASGMSEEEAKFWASQGRTEFLEQIESSKPKPPLPKFNTSDPLYSYAHRLENTIQQAKKQKPVSSSPFDYQRDATDPNLANDIAPVNFGQTEKRDRLFKELEGLKEMYNYTSDEKEKNFILEKAKEKRVDLDKARTTEKFDSTDRYSPEGYQSLPTEPISLRDITDHVKYTTVMYEIEGLKGEDVINGTSKNTAKIRDLERQLSEMNQVSMEKRSTLDQGILGAAGMLSLRYRGAIESLPYIAAGAGVGGALGAVGGPLAFASVPAGALVGAKKGFLIGNAKHMAMIQAADAYEEYIQSGMPADKARAASIIAGTGAAALEYLSLNEIAKAMPQLSGLLQSSMAAAQKSALLRYGRFLTVETGIEGMQQLTKDMTGRVAMEILKNSGHPDSDKFLVMEFEEIRDNFINELAATLPTMAVSGLISVGGDAALGAITNRIGSNQQTSNQQALEEQAFQETIRKQTTFEQDQQMFDENAREVAGDMLLDTRDFTDEVLATQQESYVEQEDVVSQEVEQKPAETPLEPEQVLLKETIKEVDNRTEDEVDVVDVDAMEEDGYFTEEEVFEEEVDTPVEQGFFSPPIQEIVKREPISEKVQTVGKKDRAYTPENTEVSYDWAVVDIGNINASHLQNLSPNPAYPQELQLRGRGRIASLQQINEIANTLNPARLGDSVLVTDGAPFINKDGFVESGNGRIIALKKVFENNQAKKSEYMLWLKENAQKFGIDPNLVNENSILVRVRDDSVGSEQFIIEANIPSVAIMSITEQAQTDSKRFKPEDLARYIYNKDNRIDTADNRTYLSKLIDSFSKSESGQLMTDRARISQQGLNKIHSAMINYVFDDPSIVNNIFESTNKDAVRLGEAITETSPNLARVKALIELGDYKDTEVMDSIKSAVGQYLSYKKQGLNHEAIKKALNQMTIGGKVNSEAVKMLVEAISKNNNSKSFLAELFNQVANYATSDEFLTGRMSIMDMGELSADNIVESALNSIGYEPEQMSLKETIKEVDNQTEDEVDVVDVDAMEEDGYFTEEEVIEEDEVSTKEEVKKAEVPQKESENVFEEINDKDNITKNIPGEEPLVITRGKTYEYNMTGSVPLDVEIKGISPKRQQVLIEATTDSGAAILGKRKWVDLDALLKQGSTIDSAGNLTQGYTSGLILGDLELQFSEIEGLSREIREAKRKANIGTPGYLGTGIYFISRESNLNSSKHMSKAIYELDMYKSDPLNIYKPRTLSEARKIAEAIKYIDTVADFQALVSTKYSKLFGDITEYRPAKNLLLRLKNAYLESDLALPKEIESDINRLDTDFSRDNKSFQEKMIELANDIAFDDKREIRKPITDKTQEAIDFLGSISKEQYPGLQYRDALVEYAVESRSGYIATANRNLSGRSLSSILMPQLKIDGIDNTAFESMDNHEVGSVLYLEGHQLRRSSGAELPPRIKKIKPAEFFRPLAEEKGTMTSNPVRVTEYSKYQTEAQLKTFENNGQEVVMTERLKKLIDRVPGEYFTEDRSPLRSVEKAVPKSIQAAARKWAKDNRPDTSENRASFYDKTKESQYQEHKILPKETLISRAKETGKTIMNTMSRMYKSVPHDEFHTPFLNETRKIASARQFASEATVRFLESFINEMDTPLEKDIFSRIVFLEDMLESAKRSELLPGDWNEKSIIFELERIKEVANDNVKKALRYRAENWEKLRSDITKTAKEMGFDLSERFNRQNYFRHIVIEYAKKQDYTGPSTANSSVSKGRSYYKERKGSNQAYITDFISAESDVVMAMHADMRLMEYFNKINSEYGLMEEYKKQAREFNKMALETTFANNPETVDYQKAYDFNKRMIAKGFKELNVLASQGVLPSENNNHRFAINALIRSTVGEEMPGLMEYISYLAKGDNLVGGDSARSMLSVIQKNRSIMKEVLGEAFQTFEDRIDQSTHGIFQPMPGKHFFGVNVIPQQYLDAALDGAMSGFMGEDLSHQVRQALAVGSDRKQFVLPNNIIEAIDSHFNEMFHTKKNLVTTTTGLWKTWVTVGNPYNTVRFNFRNFTGDVEGILMGDGAGAFKYAFESFNEIKDYQSEGIMSSDLQMFYEQGGFFGAFVMNEIQDIFKLETFKDMNPVQRESFIKKVFKSPGEFLKATRNASQFREMILRLASFKYDMRENIREVGKDAEGNPIYKPKSYGGARREFIDGSKTLADKAYLLTTARIGAYDQISEGGRWIRSRAVPFYSFQETNFKRVFNIVRNGLYSEKIDESIGRSFAKKAGVVGKLTTKGAVSLGKIVFKLSIMSAAISAWNYTMFPELEEELPAYARAEPHIIFGKDKDGNVIYFSRIGVMQDTLSWVGLQNIPNDLKELKEGKLTAKDIAHRAVQSPLNKLMNSLHPALSLAVGLISSRDMYPDVRNLRTIRDAGYFVSSFVGLQNEYSRLMGMPTNDSWAKTFKDRILTYKSNPEQAAYYDILNLKYKFNEQILKKGDSDSFYVSDRSNALYYYKLALRYGDIKSQRKYLKEYIDNGGTTQGFEQSLKTIDPLNGLTKEEAFVFVEYYLTEKDKDRLQKAHEYAIKTLAPLYGMSENVDELIEEIFSKTD